MMEIGSQKLKHVGSGECRSLGSSQYPSGRFPKVSIGITVDKCPMMGSGERREDTTALSSGVKINSCQKKVSERNAISGIAETLEGRTKVEEQNASPWLSTRSVHRETPDAETVQFYVNRASVQQAQNGMYRKLDTVAYGKKRENDGSVGRVEEVAFATMRETQLLNKGRGGKQPEQTTNCDNEALRMKLWEILGAAPSQKKHDPDPSQLEENKENGDINQGSGNQKCKVIRHKQNSDTIETDSDSPNETTRRPVTRSSTRKKAPPKTVTKPQSGIAYRKKPLSSSSDFKLRPEKNIFAFAEDGKTGTSGRTASGHSNRSKEETNEHKKAKIEPRRIYFPRSVSEKSLKDGDRIQTPPSPDTGLPQRKEERPSSCLPCQGKKAFLLTLNDVPNNSHLSERDIQKNFDSPAMEFHAGTHGNADANSGPLLKRKTYSWEHVNNSTASKDPPLHEKAASQTNPLDDTQKNFDSPPMEFNAGTHGNTDDDSPLLKRKTYSWEHVNSPIVPKDPTLQEKAASQTNPMDDFRSPTLAINESSTPRCISQNEVLHSPLLGKPRNLSRKVYSSNLLDNSTPGSSGADADSESSDDTQEIHESRDVESSHVKENEAKKVFPSTMKEQDSERSEADDIIIKGAGRRQTENWFFSAGCPGKTTFAFQSKKVQCLKDVNLGKAKLSSLSPFGTSRIKETNDFYEAMKQYPEHSLARSVAQLALVLERFRAKIKTQTSRRSIEILSTAADKIRLQLQDVESQIQADVGKFAMTGKSKRKRLELRFQEKQERLRLIHEKFKEEVNQHLLDCRSTMEELKAYRIELKGSADRQKASHRKLLLQVEQAMEAQINDAETSIAAVHKEASEKMRSLKRALKEWMEAS